MSRDRDRGQLRAWRAACAYADEKWPGAGVDERRVLANLLTLSTMHGHQLLVHKEWPARRPGRVVDAVVVSASGVFTLSVGGVAAAGEETLLAAGAEPVVRAIEDVNTTAAAVVPLRLAVGRDGVSGLTQLVGGAGARFTPPFCRRLAQRLAAALEGYEQCALPPSEPARSKEPPGPPGEGALFAVGEVRDAALEAARAEPMERWMTYLDAGQLPLVRRNWNGPARISGPAGTGKTVVGLHRAAYLAQRTSGRVLYVTYANNLPRVQETFFARMAPWAAGKVDFRSFYPFVLGLLRARAVPHGLDKVRAKTLYGLAWARAGRDTRLGRHDPSGRYWSDEIEYVIKGRGITDFARYRGVSRRGRGTRIQVRAEERELVWRLYEDYQRRLAAEGVHDFHDILALAKQALTDEPGPGTYTSVIVDEAQDLPQIGVEILHAIAGDGPNGLLLMGDGQQNIYPGGFRLGDVGIDIRGDRGQVLRRNYRNAPQILEAALGVVSDVPFEDLDGTSGRGSRDVELVCGDGQVTVGRAVDAAGLDALVADAVRAADDLAGTAVLCATGPSVTHYRGVLQAAGVPVCLLDAYTGTPVAAVKVGTYVKAKGLDFKHVLLPRYDESMDDDLARSRLFVAMTRARDTLWLGEVKGD